MAHYEEQNKWPPHDTLSHLAVHTPIQVNPRCGDNGAQGMFHPLQSGAWRLPTAFPPTFTGGQAPYYRPYGASHPQQATALQFLQEEANKKVVDWNNGNNNKALGEQIWQAEEQKAAEWQQQQHQQHTQQQTEQETSEANGTSIHLNESNTSLNGIQNGTAAVISPPLPPNRDELIAPKAIHADCETINRLINGPMPIILENKNDNGQSYESSRHSMTDSDDLEEQRLDVEVSSSSDESPKRATSPQAQPDQPQNTVMDTTEAASPVKDEVDNAEINPLLNIKTEIITSLDQPMQQTEDQEHENHKDDDASSLLLNFSQQGFLSTTSTSAVESDLLLNKESVILPTFSHPTSVSPTPATTASNGLSPDQGATFCRPPGLGPASLPPSSMNNGQQPLVCPICGFSCNSKFHYNSHMNTHGDHQCSMCDYTSRTEGRLKKHMRESHTVEEQLAAGLEVQMDQSGRVQTPPASTSTMNTSPEVSGLSTTMASLVDAANSVVNSQAQVQLTPTSLATALGMDSFLGQLTSTPNLPSALEQIRAFTEKNNMMPDPNVNLASALGVMSQTMLGSPDKGDNKSNSEPRRNSNGKQKTYKCKQCPHISMSKDEQWAHARTHIPLDKQMSCPKCNFVTEYKHHLEYHIRNHIGSKPFQCKKCSYTCVNKSMLNSHMKSHTNVYQFRCMDCTYATKYCHSLKLHLKKYGHRRVPDGTPMDDSPTQMVHPESAFQRISESVGMCLADNKSFAPPTTLAQTLGLPNFVNPSPFNYSQMLLRQNSLDQLSGLIQMPQPQLTCAVCDYQTGSKDELIRHNMSHLIGAQQPNNALLSNSSLFGSLPLTSQFTPDNSSHEGIDVVKTEDDEHEMTPDHDMPESSGSSASPSSKSSGDEGIPSRKRKAFKLEQISQRLQGKSPSVSDESSTEQHNDDENLVGEPSSSPSETHGDSMQNTPTIAQPIAQMPQPDTMSIFQQACLAHLNAMQMKQHDSDLWRFSCPHCRVAFQDQALYHIHMGYHGYEHMFKCNRCGHRAQDALNFNLHLLQASHE